MIRRGLLVMAFRAVFHKIPGTIARIGGDRTALKVVAVPANLKTADLVALLLRLPP